MTRLQAKTLARIAVILVAGAALLVFGVGAAVQAVAGFSTATIAGTWAFSASGEFGPGTPFPEGLPVATEGLFFLEEDGTCDRAVTNNIGGTTIPAPGTPLTGCSVVVNPDGTGTITLTSGGPLSPFVLDFVIVDKDEMFGITEGPAVLSFVMKRQRQPG